MCIKIFFSYPSTPNLLLQSTPKLTLNVESSHTCKTTQTELSEESLLNKKIEELKHKYVETFFKC